MTTLDLLRWMLTDDVAASDLLEGADWAATFDSVDQESKMHLHRPFWIVR